MVEYGKTPIRVTLNWLSKPFFAFLVDSKFRLIEVSPSFQQILEYSTDQVVGRDIVDFLDHSSPLNADIRNTRRTHFTDEMFHDRSFVFVNRSGSLKVIHLQASMLKESHYPDEVLCAIGQDITQQHCVESELQDRLSRLEHSLIELTQREKDVLECVVKGKLNKSIAKQMEITVRAVERIRSRLRKKFSAQTSAEMVSKATEHTVLKEFVYRKELRPK